MAKKKLRTNKFFRAMRDPLFVIFMLIFLVFLLVTLLELKPNSIPYAIFYGILASASLIAIVLRYSKIRG